MLHFDNPKNKKANDNEQSVTQTSSIAKIESSESTTPVVGQCVRNSAPSKIYLSTAVVNVYDSQEKAHSCRVLLDSGSQLNFITKELADRLQIEGRPIHMSISGVAEGSFESKRMIRVKIQSKVNAYRDSIDCVVLPKITQKVPQRFCPIFAFKMPLNIVLADPNFNVPADIDLLIGAQSFWQLLCVGQIKTCEAHPTLQKKKLGWVISSMTHGSSDKNPAASCHSVTRVAEIQRVTFFMSTCTFSKDNPADALSRGRVMPDVLPTLDVWWSGPPWLQLNECEWPSENPVMSQLEVSESRVTVTAVVKCDIFNRFSKFTRLVRLVAYCLRFVTSCRRRVSIGVSSVSDAVVVRQPLSVEELEQSRLTLVRIVQREIFGAEIGLFEKAKRVTKNSHILKLNQFMDKHDILRVGGRLKHANMPYDYKHPILLPGKHPFTRLLIVYEHECHLHVGAQGMLAAVRQNYQREILFVMSSKDVLHVKEVRL